MAWLPFDDDGALCHEPDLIAGMTPDTWDTSAAAAESVRDVKGAQRRIVLATIRDAGADGCTDDELQAILRLDGSSERPRRWELWKLNAIAIRRDRDGNAIRRQTRTGRWAVVWIVT